MVCKAIQAGACGGIVLLVLRIAVQNCRHLFTGDICVRAECGCRNAVDNAVVGCPRHSVLIVAVERHIGESASAAYGRFTLQSIQNRDEHRAGHGCIRRERRIARSGKQAFLIDEQNIIVEPIGFMYVCERQLAIRKLNFDSGRYRELVNGIGLDCADRLAVDLDVLDLIAGVRFEGEGNRLADVLECQLRFDRAVLANLQNLAQQLIDILFGADVRSAEPAIVVAAVAKRRILRIVEPVGNFAAIVIDIVPNDYIAVVQCPILQALIRVLTVDGIHPARFLAVGELAQGVSAKAGRGIDGADIVAFRTDVAQACIAHGFGKEVINRSVLLQRIRFGGNPCDVFGQVAVLCQVNILRCFERADETECDFNITRFYSIEISNSFFIDGRDTLAGFRSVHIRLCLLENTCEFLLCGGTVLLGFVAQKIVIVRFQCLVLICLLLLQNCLVRSFGSGQGAIICDLRLILSRELVVSIARFGNGGVAGFIDIANLVDHVNDFLCACVRTLHGICHVVQTVFAGFEAIIRNECISTLL